MVWRESGDLDVCVCGGVLKPRTVEVRINGGEVTLVDVPQAACTQCDSRSYRSFRITMLETLSKGAPLEPPREVW